jgi:hypothetical protein
MADTVWARCVGWPVETRAPEMPNEVDLTEPCGWTDLILRRQLGEGCPYCGGVVTETRTPLDLLSDQERATLQANLDAMATARRAGMDAALLLPLGTSAPAGAEAASQDVANAAETLKRQAIDAATVALAAGWLDTPGAYADGARICIEAAWGLLGLDLEPGDLAGAGGLARAEAAATLRAMTGERCHPGCSQPLHSGDKRAALQAGAGALTKVGLLERQLAGLRGEHELAKAHLTDYADEAIATERGLRERLRQAQALARWAADEPCQCEGRAGPGSGGPPCAPCGAKAFLSEVGADG